ncbi:MAG TPA: hypothetical protein GX008_06895 [Firmicutes bacterium]|jgi:maltose O-acetyltransferase|nr:hypothetical protein [Bacillota bacterium]
MQGLSGEMVQDIPSNTFAAGNPCRVIREITEADSMIHKPEILGDNRIME